jgi:hypothetical protein
MLTRHVHWMGNLYALGAFAAREFGLKAQILIAHWFHRPFAAGLSGVYSRPERKTPFNVTCENSLVALGLRIV